MKKLYFFIFLSISYFQFINAQEDAKKHPILTDKFLINAGLYVPSKTVKFGANGSATDKDINFGESFQFNDNESTGFLNFDWRFARMWKLSAEYFSIKNARSVTLEEDLEWEDIVFKKGSSVKAGFGLNMSRINIGRIISKGFKHEFGAGLGVHALNTNAFIEGDVKINEDEFKFERRRVTALIPLPNLGFWYFFAPSEKWLLTARLDWFAITIGEYSGGLWNIAPSVKYQLFRNFGIGADYRYFNLRANVNSSDWDGNFNMTFQGPLFTIYGNF